MTMWVQILPVLAESASGSSQHEIMMGAIIGGVFGGVFGGLVAYWKKKRRKNL
jgi:uncharacterized membrane-anchored protein YitT (DUF2179 family)